MYALNDHEGALRASLQAEYGIRLTRHGLTLSELCDLVGGLPAGCALWQSIGGPMAWSEQAHMLNVIDYRLKVVDWRLAGGKSGSQPKLQTPPPYAHERRAEESRQSARAAAWEARQARRNQA